MAVSVNVTKASHAYRKLNGVFVIYKQTGVPVEAMLKGIKSCLLAGFNELEPESQKQCIKYVPFNDLNSEQKSQLYDKCHGCSDISETLKKNNTMVPVTHLSWFHHPMVTGPQYTQNDFKITASNLLDVKSCGVQVLGIQERGEQMCNQIGRAQIPSVYHARGHLGLATASHSGDTKIIEKSTWDHVTAEKIAKVLTVIEGVHRNASMKNSGYDLSSQTAYIRASKGLLKPYRIKEPVITAVRLIEFKPPEFTIAITLMNESCRYVRSLIHNIGLELRTTAICTHLQRTYQAAFTATDTHTLLPSRMTVNSVADSIENSRLLLSQVLRPKKIKQAVAIHKNV